jgi:hypothetical protein
MSRFIQRSVLGLSLVALLVLGSTVVESQAGAAAPPPPQPQSIAGPEVVVRAGYTTRSIRSFTPPEIALDVESSAPIVVHYNGTWSAEAQNAFQYAVDLWASQINSPVEIVVEANWSSLGTGVLGSAGAWFVYPNFSGAPVADTWYPMALANAVSGLDQNGSSSEIVAYFNKDFPDWYFGTDGNTPFDKWDFVSVVLHELCHGLGFSGSMEVQDGAGYWGHSGYPMIYDRFTENGSGVPLLSFTSGSTDLAAQLQSGDIFFDGPHARAFNGGLRPELYAPSTWQPGSSYSHVDEGYNDSPDALMTYSIFNGETSHLAGPIVQGMFKDMGWTFNPHLEITGQPVGGGDVEPGDPVTFTLSVANDGAAIATGVVVTSQLSVDITAGGWDVSPSLPGTTLRAGDPYTWDLPDLGPGATGVITVYGTLASPLPSQYVVSSQATIATAEAEADLSDNTTSMIVIIDPLQTFLPLVLTE